jgi:hypothetical protein
VGISEDSVWGSSSLEGQKGTPGWLQQLHRGLDIWRRVTWRCLVEAAVVSSGWSKNFLSPLCSQTAWPHTRAHSWRRTTNQGRLNPALWLEGQRGEDQESKSVGNKLRRQELRKYPHDVVCELRDSLLSCTGVDLVLYTV